MSLPFYWLFIHVSDCVVSSVGNQGQDLTKFETAIVTESKQKRDLYFMALKDFVNELEKLDNLTKLLADQKDIIDGVDSWTSSFVSYVQLATGSTGFPKFNDTFFNSILIQVGWLPC